MLTAAGSEEQQRVGRVGQSGEGAVGVGKKERAQLVWTEMQRRLAHSVGRMKAAKGAQPPKLLGRFPAP